MQWLQLQRQPLNRVAQEPDGVLSSFTLCQQTTLGPQCSEWALRWPGAQPWKWILSGANGIADYNGGALRYCAFSYCAHVLQCPAHHSSSLASC